MGDESMGQPSSSRDQPGPTDRSGRRAFLRKAAVGGAVAWTLPTVLSSSPAAAQGSGLPPVFVGGSAATSYTGESSSTRSITLTSTGLLAGDLWMAIVAYDARGNINLPAGAGWSSSGPASGGVTNGLTPNYSVRAYVVWRVLLPGDLSGGTFAQSFTSTTTNLVHGGLRGAAVAYRGTNLQAVVSPNSGSGPVSSNVVTSTFPAVTGNPIAAPNAIVRLGAARGYGGWNALDPNIDWQTWPGTGRVDFSSGNEGDRALVISEQIDATGASATGTWYRQSGDIITGNNTGWAAFTAAVTNAP